MVRVSLVVFLLALCPSATLGALLDGVDARCVSARNLFTNREYYDGGRLITFDMEEVEGIVLWNYPLPTPPPCLVAHAPCVEPEEREAAHAFIDADFARRLPNVTVRFDSEETGECREVTTMSPDQRRSYIAGRYRIQLPPGLYRITVDHEPFPRFEARVRLTYGPRQRTAWVRHEVLQGLLVHPYTSGISPESDHPTLGFVDDLNIGLSLNTVETTTVLGRGPLDGVLGRSISRQRLDAPLVGNGRTLQAIGGLTPGVVMTEGAGTLGQFTAAGQRRLSNRLLIDGVNADLAVDLGDIGIGESASATLPAFATSGGTQTLVPFDAIEEYSIRTAGAQSAEFGQSPGAQTVVVTRSGGDQPRGGMFTQHRPRALAAADPFLTPTGNGRRFSSTNPGASLGGPIRRGRSFYFASWEEQQTSRPYHARVQVPARSIRESASPIVGALLQGFPQPNGETVGTGLESFSYPFPVSSHLDVISVRADANLQRGQRLFVRANVGGSNGNAASANQTPDVSFEHRESTTTRTVTLGTSSSASASFMHELRLNLSKNQGTLVAATAPYGGAREVPIANFVGVGAINPWLRINAFPGPGGQLFAGQTGAAAQEQTQIVGAVTMTLGRHEIRFGADLARVTGSRDGASRYTYTFTNALQLLAGRPRQVLIENWAPTRVHSDSAATFAQDLFRVSDRLTVSYGVRYSVDPAPFSGDARDPALMQFDALPDLQPRPAGSRLWRTAWANVAPNVSITYRRPALSRELVIRAGWDRVYDDLTTVGVRAFGRGVPYVSNRFLGLVTLPVPPEELTPAAPGGTLSEYFAFPEDLATPRTYRWHLGADYALVGKHRLSLAYVGAAARRLPYWHAYYPGNAEVASIQAFSNDGRSDYHGLYLEYTHPPSRQGLQATVNYAWSHAIDNDSGETTIPNAPPSFIAPAINRGSADYDRRHVVRATGSYRTPTLDGPRPIRTLLNGWRIDLIGTARSGAPVSVTVSRSMAGEGIYVVRPDVVSNAPIWIDDPSSPTGKRLNVGAFETPFIFRQGTMGRNTLRASPLRQIDFALSRWLRLGRVSIEGKLEAFNVFNFANFGPPASSLGFEPFGVPRLSLADALGTGTLVQGGLIPLHQAGGPRSVQLGLRFAW
jgi:hypothetical protein